LTLEAPNSFQRSPCVFIMHCT